jgi:hypothetical protein
MLMLHTAPRRTGLPTPVLEAPSGAGKIVQFLSKIAPNGIQIASGTLSQRSHVGECGGFVGVFSLNSPLSQAQQNPLARQNQPKPITKLPFFGPFHAPAVSRHHPACLEPCPEQSEWGNEASTVIRRTLPVPDGYRSAFLPFGGFLPKPFFRRCSQQNTRRFLAIRLPLYTRLPPRKYHSDSRRF